MTTVEVIRELFESRGHSEYGFEVVTQLEHALQAAHSAEQESATPELITAALLHDVGHLLHKLPDDAPDQGIDDRHEILGRNWLQKRFGPEVSEPVRLHVDAKRYLCAVDADYDSRLSEPSRQSMELQGGIMTQSEAREFSGNPFCQDAVNLRRWDDNAKIAGLETPTLEHFLTIIADCANDGSRSEEKSR